ncbi:MAG: hypothetical protein ACI8PZ_000009 [Myxococcota bacterium]|jgi:hypothetical protein
MSAEPYYRACHGRWSGPFRLRVTDRAALRAERGLPEALGWVVLSLLPGLRLSTTVHVDSPTAVRHTTRLHWGPLTLLAGEEALALDGDRLVMTGTSRTLLGQRDTVHGTGTVDPTSIHATYEVTWMRMAVHQTGERTGSGVTLRQRGPGFESVVHLVRQPDP